MSTNLTLRTVTFLSSDSSFDQAGIMADASIVSMADSAFGKVLQVELKPYFTEAAGVYTFKWSMQLTVYVTASVDSSILSGISALQARWPTYQVVTWSQSPLLFG